MKPKLIIVGAAGRMGRRITALAAESKNFDIIGLIEDKNNPEVGRDMEQVGVKISSEFPVGANVVINFFLPIAFGNPLDYCLKNKAALVCGTTGMADEQLKKI